jgi:hypothetical protein
VFCGQCGKNLPDDVKFCQSCGRATAPTPIQTNFASAAAAAPALSSSPEPKTRLPGAPYWWFAFQVACFTACAAGFVFLISEATATLDPNQFQKVGGSIMGVLFTAIWASRTWKRVQEVEPEIDGNFKLKHRSFLLRSFGLVFLFLSVACALGVASGRSQTKANSLAEKVVELNREQTELDQRFAQTFTGKNFVQPASLSSPQVSANSLREIEQYASASEDLGGRKEALLQGKPAPLLRAQFEAARVMFSATEELYRYASDPWHQVHLENGVIVIVGIDEYEKRVDAVNDALRKFDAASAALNEEQGRFRSSSLTSR